MPRETWTDERLDDLNLRVENGFNRVDADLRALRSEMNGRFESLEGRMDSRFDAVDSRFGSLEARMDSRFDALQRTILQVGGGAIATFLIGFAGLIVTHA